MCTIHLQSGATDIFFLRPLQLSQTDLFCDIKVHDFELVCQVFSKNFILMIIIHICTYFSMDLRIHATNMLRRDSRAGVSKG